MYILLNNYKMFMSAWVGETPSFIIYIAKKYHFSEIDPSSIFYINGSSM